MVGNTADHNNGHGIYVTNTSTDNTVTDNEASFNAEGWQRNANGIDVTSPGNTVLRNVLHDNEDSGLQFYTGGDNNLAALNVTYNNGDHGIDNLNVTGGRVIGNTVYRNCTSGINVEGTSTNYTVVNNVAVDNAVYPAYNGISCARRAGNIGIWDSAPPTTTVDHNLVQLTKAGTMYVFKSAYTSLAAMQTATGQEANGVQADPKFLAKASGDLQLTEGSPAIDRGDSAVSGAQDHDVLGNVRVRDDQRRQLARDRAPAVRRPRRLRVPAGRRQRPDRPGRQAVGDPDERHRTGRRHRRRLRLHRPAGPGPAATGSTSVTAPAPAARAPRPRPTRTRPPAPTPSRSPRPTAPG